MTCEICSSRLEMRHINGQPLRFLVEALRPCNLYLFTIDEAANLLRAVPGDDLEGLDLVVFHQPAVGEKAGCCWGAYTAEYRYEGRLRRAILLNSVNSHTHMVAVRQADRDAAQETECLREEGHKIALIDGRYIIASSRDAIRVTQLYRSIYHQVYHHVRSFRGIPLEADDERLANGYARQVKARWISETMQYD